MSDTPRTDEAFSVSLEWHQYVAHVREKCAEMEGEIFVYQKALLDRAADAAKARRDLAAANVEIAALQTRLDEAMGRNVMLKDEINRLRDLLTEYAPDVLECYDARKP